MLVDVQFNIGLFICAVASAGADAAAAAAKKQTKMRKIKVMRCAFNLSSCSFSDIEFQTISQTPTNLYAINI